MLRKPWLLILIFLCAIFFITSANVSASGKMGTIILKSGEKIKNIAFKADKQFQVVTCTLKNGEKRNVSFTDIFAILDEDNYNIAPELLGKYYRQTESTTNQIEPAQPDEPTDGDTATMVPDVKKVKTSQTSVWKSEQSEIYRRQRIRSWDVGFRFGTNYSVPLSHWYDGTKSGFGFEGSFLVSITYEITLRFEFSRSGMRLDEKDFFVYPPAGAVLQDKNFSLAVNRYIVAVEYFHQRGPMHPGQIIPHIWVGMGAASHTLRANAYAYDSGTDTHYYLNEDNSLTRFIASIGGGLVYMLSENVGLDIAVTLDDVFAEKARDNDYSYYSDGFYHAFIFDGKLGFLFRF